MAKIFATFVVVAYLTLTWTDGAQIQDTIKEERGFLKHRQDLSYLDLREDMKENKLTKRDTLWIETILIKGIYSTVGVIQDSFNHTFERIDVVSRLVVLKAEDIVLRLKALAAEVQLETNDLIAEVLSPMLEELENIETIPYVDEKLIAMDNFFDEAVDKIMNLSKVVEKRHSRGNRMTEPRVAKTLYLGTSSQDVEEMQHLVKRGKIPWSAMILVVIAGTVQKINETIYKATGKLKELGRKVWEKAGDLVKKMKDLASNAKVKAEEIKEKIVDKMTLRLEEIKEIPIVEEQLRAMEKFLDEAKKKISELRQGHDNVEVGSIKLTRSAAGSTRSIVTSALWHNEGRLLLRRQIIGWKGVILLGFFGIIDKIKETAHKSVDGIKSLAEKVRNKANNLLEKITKLADDVKINAGELKENILEPLKAKIDEIKGELRVQDQLTALDEFFDEAEVKMEELKSVGGDRRGSRSSGPAEYVIASAGYSSRKTSLDSAERQHLEKRHISFDLGDFIKLGLYALVEKIKEAARNAVDKVNELEKKFRKKAEELISKLADLVSGSNLEDTEVKEKLVNPAMIKIMEIEKIPNPEDKLKALDDLYDYLRQRLQT